MVSVQRTFTVHKPIDTVVEYLSDFSHAEQWDPGTLTCEREDDGPVREGSRWRNVSVFMGRRAELSYRLERLEPTRLTFVGSNASVDSTDDLILAPADGAGGSTSITYRADLRFRGPARFAAPVLRIAFERIATMVRRQMVTVIDAL